MNTIYYEDMTMKIMVSDDNEIVEINFFIDNEEITKKQRTKVFEDVISDDIKMEIKEKDKMFRKDNHFSLISTICDELNISRKVFS